MADDKILDRIRSNPTDAAERKGRQAYRDGLSEGDCPYRDKRKADGRLTFSRAWRNAWVQGFRTEKSAKETAV